MIKDRSLKIGVVCGEHSGDTLGAPNVSPECSPQTTPIFRDLSLITYLRIPLSDAWIDFMKFSI